MKLNAPPPPKIIPITLSFAKNLSTEVTVKWESEQGTRALQIRLCSLAAVLMKLFPQHMSLLVGRWAYAFGDAAAEPHG